MAPTKWEVTEQCIFLPSTHFSYVSIFVSFPLLICHLRDDRCAKRSARNNLQPCILVSLHLTLHHGVSRRDTCRISRRAAEIIIRLQWVWIRQIFCCATCYFLVWRSHNSPCARAVSAEIATQDCDKVFILCCCLNVYSGSVTPAPTPRHPWSW